MNIKQLAIKGMKGRKKDTRLLEIVVSFTFLFLMIAVLYQGSSLKTKEHQRYDSYGQWKVGYFSGTKEVYDQIKANNELKDTKVGLSIILGESDDYQTIGTINNELLSMGNISLVEGEYPKVQPSKRSNRNLIPDVELQMFYYLEKEQHGQLREGFYKKYGVNLVEEKQHKNPEQESSKQEDSYYQDNIENRTTTRFEENIRENTYAYPNMTGSEDVYLTKVIILCIFIAGSGLIFQIFLIQLKRRSRKFVLFRSIGASTSQLLKIMVYEGLHLLKIGLCVGITGGFLLTYGIITILNTLFHKEISFYMDVGLILLGLLGGIMALVLGFVVSMVISMRTPLTGTLNPPPKHKKLKHKQIQKDSHQYRSLSRGKSIENNKDESFNGKHGSTYNKKERTRKTSNKSMSKLFLQSYGYHLAKNIVSFLILVIILLVEISGIYLCFSSYQTYQRDVVNKAMPSYQLKSIYGDREKNIEEILETIEKIEGVEGVESYKKGNNTFLWYQGIENNVPLGELESLLPTSYLQESFNKYHTIYGGEEEVISQAYVISLYGINSESDLYDKYIKNLNEGTLDIEKFNKGEEVILMIPLHQLHKEMNHIIPLSNDLIKNSTTRESRYHKVLDVGNRYKTTFSKNMQDIYSKPSDLKVGDTIYLSIDTEEIKEDVRTYEYRTVEATVGGIIYYFNEESIWPHSDNVSGYTVITSKEGFHKLYISARHGLISLDLRTMKLMVNTLFPNKYGETYYNIYGQQKESLAVTEGKLLEVANEYGLEFTDYQEQINDLKGKAQNITLILGIFAVSTAFIHSIILYNTMISRMDQEKNNIGIFQALGVKERKYINQYGIMGLIHGVGAVIVVNVVLFTFILFSNMRVLIDGDISASVYLNYILRYTLETYPFALHIICCVVIIIQSILTNLILVRKVIKDSPINNIRSL